MANDPLGLLSGKNNDVAKDPLGLLSGVEKEYVATPGGKWEKPSDPLGLLSEEQIKSAVRGQILSGIEEPESEMKALGMDILSTIKDTGLGVAEAAGAMAKGAVATVVGGLSGVIAGGVESTGKSDVMYQNIRQVIPDATQSEDAMFWGEKVWTKKGASFANEISMGITSAEYLNDAKSKAQMVGLTNAMLSTGGTDEQNNMLMDMAHSLTAEASKISSSRSEYEEEVAAVAEEPRAITEFNMEAATRVIEDVSGEATKYLTERGEKATEVVMKPFEIISESSKWWGDKIYEATGNPSLAASASAGLEIAANFALPGLAGKLRGNLKAASAAKTAAAKEAAEAAIRQNLLDIRKAELEALRAEPNRLGDLSLKEYQLKKQSQLDAIKTEYEASKIGEPLKKPEPISPKKSEFVDVGETTVRDSPTYQEIYSRSAEGIGQSQTPARVSGNSLDKINAFRREQGLPEFGTSEYAAKTVEAKPISTDPLQVALTDKVVGKQKVRTIKPVEEKFIEVEGAKVVDPTPQTSKAPVFESAETTKTGVTKSSKSQKVTSREYSDQITREPYNQVAEGTDAKLTNISSADTYQTLKTALPRMKEKAVAATEAFVNALDVEAPYRRIGSPNTGLKIKNMASMQTAKTEFALHYADKLGQMVNRSRTDMARIPLLYEKPAKFKALKKQEQTRLKESVDEFGKFFEDAKQQYSDYGIELDFTKRISEEIQSLIDEGRKSGLDEGSILDLENALKEAQDMNFVHIPSAMWFDHLVRTNPEAASRALKLQATQKRKSFSINDLIDNGVISESQVHAADIIASYGRRMGRDFALLDVVDAAKAEGLAIPKNKWSDMLKSDPTLEGKFVDAPPSASILKGYKLHNQLAKTVDDMVKWRDPQSLWDKVTATTKGYAFANPVILPMNDFYQSVMARSWDSIARADKAFTQSAKGFKDVYKQTPEYWEAGELGLFSKTQANPWESWKAKLDSVKVDLPQRIFDKTGATIKNPIKEIYTLSHNLAWAMDEGMRMGTYRYFIDKGFSKPEAAQIAAKFHGDYASIPAKTRKALNRTLFTPTFKIAMGKLYGEMLTGAIKEAPMNVATLINKQGKPNYRANAMAKGLVGTVAIVEGFDLLMESYGFKTDEWGRKYSKEVVTEEGAEEVVVTFSGPHNMAQRFFYRFDSAMDLTNEGSFISNIIARNSWEITPALRLVYSLGQNQRPNGDQIYNSLDDAATIAADIWDYSAKNIVAMAGAMDTDEKDVKARKVLQEETSRAFDYLTRLVSFSYMRGPEAGRLEYKMKNLESLFYQALFSDEGLTDERLENFQEAVYTLVDEQTQED